MGKLARERPCSATAEGTWRRDPNLLQDLRLARVPLSLRVLCTQITRVRFGPKPAHADVSRRSSALHSGAGRIPFRKENQLEFARDREEAVRSEEFLAATSFGTRSTGFGISRSAFPPWDSTSKLTCEKLPVYLAEPLMTRPGAPLPLTSMLGRVSCIRAILWLVSGRSLQVRYTPVLVILNPVHQAQMVLSRSEPRIELRARLKRETASSRRLGTISNRSHPPTWDRARRLQLRCFHNSEPCPE